MVYGQEKFLLFRYTDDDAAMYPLSRLKHYRCTEYVVYMTFDSGNTDVDDVIVLTAAAGDNELSVIEIITRAINGSKDNYIVISDSVAGEYVTPYAITAIIG